LRRIAAVNGFICRGDGGRVQRLLERSHKRNDTSAAPRWCELYDSAWRASGKATKGMRIMAFDPATALRFAFLGCLVTSRLDRWHPPFAERCETLVSLPSRFVLMCLVALRCAVGLSPTADCVPELVCPCEACSSARNGRSRSTPIERGR
jgi:hypothetical protein